MTNSINNISNPTKPTATIAQEATPLISVCDFNSLRLTQDYGGQFDVVRVITRVPVGKPPKSSFFRVHPGAAFAFETLLLELKESNEQYIVTAAAASTIPELVRAVRLHLAVDQQGNPYLIPLPLPNASGAWNPWHQSLNQALQLAMKKWTRISANMAAGSYDVFVAQGALGEPVWPDKTMEELLEIAFRDRIISSDQHPVIAQLLGLA